MVRNIADYFHDSFVYVSSSHLLFFQCNRDSQSDQWKRNKRSIELNQGRAAMMGITGLMVHDLMGNVDKLLPPSF